MTASEQSEGRIWEFVTEYCDNVQDGFSDRWSKIKPDIYHKHIHESIGALLARQATLSIELAKAPSMWNGHVAPLILRCMTDAFITLAWILEEPLDRSTKYVHYGLGQEKLYIEYLEHDLQESPDADDDDAAIKEMVRIRKEWLNSQLAEWATEVNVGAWSGMSTREMAKEIGRESLYKFAYVPFSGPAHNMWQHVGIYNMRRCKNALHKYHLVPSIASAPLHPDFMYRSAKYLSQTYELFDEKMNVKSGVPLPVDFFVSHSLFSGKTDTQPSERR
jgi:hypothetical protein